VDELEIIWNALCRQAWAEQDPVKFLDVTMKIRRFLDHKQQRLDAEFDERERKQGLN
jgi:hypothetical protein